MNNFTLYAGAHRDPSEGACLVEAAVFNFAGEWKKISSPDDAPACFSRTLCEYGIALNDAMPDDIRTKLLAPFVEMLPGSAAPLEVESKRAEILVWCAIRHSVPFALRAINNHEQADRLEKAGTLEEASDIMKHAVCASPSAMITFRAVNVLTPNVPTYHSAEWAVECAAEAALYASQAVNEDYPVFDWAPCVQAFRDAFAVER